MLADCKGLKRTFDFHAFMHIEIIDGVSYLTFKWDKHRDVSSPPLKDKTPAWAFGEFGIMDDINDADSTIYDIYDDDRVILLETDGPGEGLI